MNEVSRAIALAALRAFEDLLAPGVYGRGAHAVRRDRLRRKRGFEPYPLQERRRVDHGDLLFPERSWTADERAAPKIKSQEAVRIP